MISGAAPAEEGNAPTEEGNASTEEGNKPTDSEYRRLDPLPLRCLCPVCFAAGVETLFLCFDGNFQLRTLKPPRGSIPIELRHLYDCRLIVDKIPPNVGEEKVCVSLYAVLISID